MAAPTRRVARPRLPGLPEVLTAGYVLEQLVAVPNWRAVHWTGTQHVTHRVYLLGLANNATAGDPPLLIALTYTPTAGWQVADQDPAYCGLLPPDWDLVPFEAENPCGHVPSP